MGDSLREFKEMIREDRNVFGGCLWIRRGVKIVLDRYWVRRG